jgi:hypothetical protein
MILTFCKEEIMLDGYSLTKIYMALPLVWDKVSSNYLVGKIVLAYVWFGFWDNIGYVWGDRLVVLSQRMQRKACDL